MSYKYFFLVIPWKMSGPGGQLQGGHFVKERDLVPFGPMHTRNLVQLGSVIVDRSQAHLTKNQ